MGSYSPAGPGGRASEAEPGWGHPSWWLPTDMAGLALALGRGRSGAQAGPVSTSVQGPPLPRAGPALRSSWEELESRPGCGPRPELCPPQGRQQWAQPLLGAPARPLPQALPSPWPCTYGARARVCTTGFLTLNTASGDQSCADHLACSPWPTPLRPPRTHGSPRASPPVCLGTCHTQSAGLCLPRAQAAHPRPSRL